MPEERPRRPAMAALRVSMSKDEPDPSCLGMRTGMPLAFRPDDRGILPDRMIAALAQAGGIIAAAEFAPDQIQPASLDFRLGEVAFRVGASFLPGPGGTA